MPFSADHSQFWVALGALAFMVFCQSGLVAWHMGRLFERGRTNTARIEKLEADDRVGSDGASAINLSVQAVKIEMSHLVEDMKELKNSLGWMRRVAAPDERSPK